MSTVVNYMGMSIVEPDARIRELANYGNMIEVDPNMPVQRLPCKKFMYMKFLLFYY